MNYSHLLLLSLLITTTRASPLARSILTGTLQTIFTRVFYDKSISVSITLHLASAKHQQFTTAVLEDLLKENGKRHSVPVSVNKYSAPILSDFINVRLIFAENSKEIEIGLKRSMVYDQIHSEPSKFLIILNNRKHQIRKQWEMLKIFKLFFNYNFVDVVILVPAHNTVHMYSFFPFTSKRCSCVRPTLMRSFRKIPEYLSYYDLFPIKTKNFYQCPMSVVVWNLPPYMQLTKHPNETISYKGFDASMLREIANALNFSIKLVPNEPPGYIGGNVLENKTAFGVFKMLIDNRVNITIGCISCMPKRMKVTSASTSYFVQEFVIALKNSVMITPLELLLKPFHSYTWWFLLSALLLKKSLYIICRRKLRIPQKFRNLFYLKWLYLLFLLRISYEGSMFKVINNPPYKPLPQTIESVIEQNYTIITDYATDRILETIPAVKAISQVVEGSPTEIMELIDRIPEKTAILTSRAYLAHFMTTRLSHHSEYTILREKLANGLNCIYFPRNSFLAPAVNGVLSRLKNYGFKQRYMAEMGFENLPFTTDKWLHSRRSGDGSVLGLHFLQTVFKVLLFIHMCAVIVFIFELISFHLCRKNIYLQHLVKKYF